ncbi:MAG: hypothetical protein ABR568_18315 [Pyrinomonadaceae bacterium]
MCQQHSASKTGTVSEAHLFRNQNEDQRAIENPPGVLRMKLNGYRPEAPGQG